MSFPRRGLICPPPIASLSRTMQRRDRQDQFTVFARLARRSPRRSSWFWWRGPSPRRENIHSLARLGPTLFWTKAPICRPALQSASSSISPHREVSAGEFRDTHTHHFCGQGGGTGRRVSRHTHTPFLWMVVPAGELVSRHDHSLTVNRTLPWGGSRESVHQNFCGWWYRPAS